MSDEKPRAELLIFTGNPRANCVVPPEMVLETALAESAELVRVLVIGEGGDGTLHVWGTDNKTAQINFLVDRFKHKLLSGDYDED